MTNVEIRHFHFFCGLGGGAKGFNMGNARVGNMKGVFRCIGGVDIDAGAIRDFNKMAGVQGTVLDMFDRSQYISFHGREPGPDWKEATTADIHRAAGNERPHIVFLSAPCKGFSGLLSQKTSITEKYQALNRLTLRGIWLMLEAWKHDPVELIVFENVPRIQNRGRPLLDQIISLLHHYGYAVAESSHDCGELGNLAQSRKRFLLVARHKEKIPAYLHVPSKKPLRGVGEIPGRMPIPGNGAGGPMPRIPRLQWKTWVRLAFIEAGSDWRSLKKLNVQDGYLRDYLIIPEFHGGFLGVNKWDEHSGTVTSRGSPSCGNFSVADPRPPDGKLFGKYAVTKFDDPAGTVISSDDNGAYAVADPRMDLQEYGQYGVLDWKDPAGTIIGVKAPGQGKFSVADPRCNTSFDGKGKYIITPFEGPANTVISGSTTGQGAFAVADPRPNMDRERGDDYLTAGHYGVVPWESSCGAVAASACHDNGRFSVADPRLPASVQKLVCMIRSLDNTWHRPFTTLELAALQGLLEPEEHFEMDGLSDSAWRERIGNAVPPPAAAAIAGMMGQTLLLAWSGETFLLSSAPVWVRPIAIALSVDNPGLEAA